MLLLSFVVVLTSQIPVKFFFRGIKAIIFIVSLTVILQMFMTPGEIMWQFGIFKITKRRVSIRQFLWEQD